MKKESATISFTLQGIETKQFATFGNGPLDTQNIHEQIEFTFGADEAHHIIACIFRYTLMEVKKVFLVVEISCDFQLDSQDWKPLIDKKDKKLILPKGFVQHLANITVGITRGVVHAKTENTPFNHFPVGLVNLKSLLNKDVEIDLVL
jgi:hypothetical protein